MRSGAFVVAVGFLSGGCGLLLGEYRVERESGDEVLAPCEDGSGDREGPAIRDGSGQCVSVGPVCNAEAGFLPTGDGACTAVLPPDCSTLPGVPGQMGCPVHFGKVLSTAGREAGLDAVPRSEWIWVDGDPTRNTGAPADADGTADSPFFTIQQGVDAAPDGGVVAVLGWAYREDVLIERPVRLVGDYDGKTFLVGLGSPVGDPATAANRFPCDADGTRPAICIGPGASGTVVGGIAIEGTAGDQAIEIPDTSPAGGIAVAGARDVVLMQLAVRFTGRAGIRIEDHQQADVASPTPASVTIDDVLVMQGTGHGIFVAGSDVTVRATEIWDTLPLGQGRDESERGESIGIAVRPSSYFTPSPPETTFTLEGSRVRDHGSVGVSVEGVTATIERSFIGGSATDGVEPMGIGVVVRRSFFGAQASLSIRDSVIEGASDAGIEVVDSMLAVADTTIRGTRASGCTGQGLRVRGLEGTGTAATLLRVAIEDSAQSAIHTEGGNILVEDAILRRSVPPDGALDCFEHFGDGIAAEATADAPGEVTVRRSRLEHHARAAIATFGTPVVLDTTALGCSPAGIAVSADEAVELSNASCGCADTWALCERETSGLEPWLFPGAGSGLAPGSVLSGVAGVYESATLVARPVLFDPTLPALPRRRGSNDGSYTWHAPRDVPFVAAYQSPDAEDPVIPIFVPLSGGHGDVALAAIAGTLTFPLAGNASFAADYTTARVRPAGGLISVTNGAAALFWKELPADAPDPAAQGTGIMFQSITMVVRGDAAQGAVVDDQRFPGVPAAFIPSPGWVEVEVVPTAPNGGIVECTFDLGNGWTQGAPGERPNSVRVRVYEGMHTSMMATCWELP